MIVDVTVGVLVGLAVSIGYFQALQWTVERVTRGDRSAAFLVGSFFLRAVVLFAVGAALASMSIPTFASAAAMFGLVRYLYVSSNRRALACD